MDELAAKKLVYLISKAQKQLKEEKNIKLKQIHELYKDIKLAEQLIDVLSEDKNQDVRKLININSKVNLIKHNLRKKELEIKER